MSFGANLLRTFRVLGIGIFVLITFKFIFSKQMLDCDTARPPMLTTSSLPLKTQEPFHFEGFTPVSVSLGANPAVLDRAMKAPGCQLPLLCAWSVATQVRDEEFLKTTATYHLFLRKQGDQKALDTGGSNFQHGPVGEQGLEVMRDRLNDLYEEKKLADLSLPLLSIPSNIHVIPMGAEPYFRRTLRDADMVLEGLWLAGVIPHHGSWLDFGGSHGRVTRVLASAFPQAEWHCSDPILDSIDWGKSNIQNVHFHQSEQDPPMSGFSSGQLDGVYAISIWSHYSEESALAWFHEMHRILKPGGILWFSTHGFQSINYGSLDGAVQKSHREEMLAALYLTGFFYFPMFGAKGDWHLSDGAQGTKWGFAAMTTEWLAARLLNVDRRWTLLYFGPGRNEKNQDVYVLRRT